MRPSFENVGSLKGSPTLSMPALPSLGLNSDDWSSRDRLLDRRLARGRVEPLALGRREDDVQDRALLGGELRLDQVGRLLRVRPGDLELVAQRTADRPDEDDQDDDDADPAEDDTPGMRRACAHPARERARRQSFVSLAAAGGRLVAVVHALRAVAGFSVFGVGHAPPRRV